jgi:hypothetical protein
MEKNMNVLPAKAVTNNTGRVDSHRKDRECWPKTEKIRKGRGLCMRQERQDSTMARFSMRV